HSMDVPMKLASTTRAIGVAGRTSSFMGGSLGSFVSTPVPPGGGSLAFESPDHLILHRRQAFTAGVLESINHRSRPPASASGRRRGVPAAAQRTGSASVSPPGDTPLRP